ncbi:hypothetical protein STCU_02448 [Strigomonas culicis]|uniref:Uncharacterized protein n=1 Tax=Strigomonas culicis TaxID=28005 RepID=S9WB30_9TRYP|nr:hypothetical protein STCU_02448 [Strigomonas culicis]|eukprot:EPY33180.1 hypothetical protein STCU_02448 [Strigomonas culicis]
MAEVTPVRKAVANEYHCATLVGNWEEERKTFGQPLSASAGASSALDTTYTASYKRLSPGKMAAARPSGCFADEAPKELLFFHGDCTKPEKNSYSIAELSYTDRQVDPTTHEEVLNRTGVSQRQDRTSTLRRTLGLSGNRQAESTAEDRSNASMRETQYLRSLNGAEKQDGAVGDDGDYRPPSIPPVGRVDERSRLMTTKHVTTDATGEYLKSNLEPYPLTSSDCVGELMNSRNDPMHKTKLRVHYKTS